MSSIYDKCKQLLYLQRHIDITSLIHNHANYEMNEIATYYKKTHWLFYKTFASKHGFMHIGLSEDGTYRKNQGYELYHLQVINQFVTDTNAKRVLEIGCGQCANLKYLAALNPDIQFYGIDLAPKLSGIRKRNNITVFTDDFHEISSIKDNSIDLAFAIETICYSLHKRDVVTAVQRKLKAGGTFLIFDIFLGSTKDRLSDVDKVYLAILENSYCLSPLEPCTSFLHYAEESGFILQQSSCLTDLAIPYLKEIESRMMRHLKYGGIFLRLMLSLWPWAVVRSMPPGMLMRQMVEDGYLQYHLYCLRSPSTASCIKDDGSSEVEPK